MLTHVDRRTGRKRAALLEVVSREANPTTWYVAAAWADRSDWYRNLQQDPNAEVSVGRSRDRVVARQIDGDEAVRIYGEYVRAHPRARERFKRRANPGTEAVVQGDAVHLPLVDGVFDGGC